MPASGEFGEVDPDDAPELTEEFFRRAEIRAGGKLVRAATGRLTKDGVRPGRPLAGDAAKQQVTLRPGPDVVTQFRDGGPGWQTRINAALRKAVGLK